jgi:nucleotidyltransferase/DNA polymerase involved in DNA repair
MIELFFTSYVLPNWLDLFMRGLERKDHFSTSATSSTSTALVNDFDFQDYDCFYASVFEHQNPALKAQPLGVKQKSILATANYVARSRGVKKLTPISEALKACPDLVIVNGEDLTPFRDASKRLFSCFRSYSWNGKIERLGLDEVFMGGLRFLCIPVTRVDSSQY